MADPVAKRTKYRVLNGLSWYGNKRAEAGEIRSDIPAKSVPWLLEQGHIEEIEPEKAAKGKGD